MQQPLQRGGAGRGLQAAEEGPRAHPGLPGQVLDGERAFEVGGGPLQDRGQAVVVRDRYREVHELGLPAGPVRRNHHPPGESVGHPRAEVPADDVQTEVQSGGHPRAGQHIAVVHVEHAVVDGDAWVPLGQVGGVRPVRGGPPSVEDAGGRERERAGAERYHARSGRRRAPEFRDERRGHLALPGHAGVRDGGDDHGVRVREGVPAVLGAQREAERGGGGASRAGGGRGGPGGCGRCGRLRAEAQVVPAVGQVGLGDAEHRAGHAEFVEVPERDVGVVEDGDRDGARGGGRRGAGRYRVGWRRGSRR